MPATCIAADGRRQPGRRRRPLHVSAAGPAAVAQPALHGRPTGGQGAEKTTLSHHRAFTPSSRRTRLEWSSTYPQYMQTAPQSLALCTMCKPCAEKGLQRDKLRQRSESSFRAQVAYLDSRITAFAEALAAEDLGPPQPVTATTQVHGCDYLVRWSLYSHLRTAQGHA